MSTDEQHNTSDERSPQSGEESAEQSSVHEQTPVESAEPQTAEENSSHSAPEGAESEHGEPTATAEQAEEPGSQPAAEQHASHEETGAVPAADETHVALPAQRRDDPFSEVDGGESESSQQPTTAFPTPEEDAALRDERARRFGRPQSESDPAHEAPEAHAPQEEPVPAAEEETTRVPLAAAGAGAVASVGAGDSHETQSTRTLPATTTEEEDPFKDFDEGPASRAAAHWWSILISLVFVPVAWYLIADGGERLTWNLTNSQPFNWAGPAELAGGALCLFFVLLAARWSSVGAILVGTVAALAGIAFIVANAEAMDLVTEYQGTLVQALKQLGQNIVDHLLADARSGRLAIYGIVLIMAGVISHGARRQGRREERRKAAIGA